MQSLTMVVLLSAMGTGGVAAGDRYQEIRDRLEQIRQQRRLFEIRKRLVVLPFANETPKEGAGKVMTESAREFLAARDYELIPAAKVATYLQGMGAQSAWSADDLARVAQDLNVETVVTGVLTRFEGKKKLGLPLPASWISTQADVGLEATVYRRSKEKVDWQGSLEKKEKVRVGGSALTRDEVRDRTGREAVEELLARYFEAPGP